MSINGKSITIGQVRTYFDIASSEHNATYARLRNDLKVIFGTYEVVSMASAEYEDALTFVFSMDGPPFFQDPEWQARYAEKSTTEKGQQFWLYFRVLVGSVMTSIYTSNKKKRKREDMDRPGGAVEKTEHEQGSGIFASSTPGKGDQQASGSGTIEVTTFTPPDRGTTVLESASSDKPSGQNKKRHLPHAQGDFGSMKQQHGKNGAKQANAAFSSEQSFKKLLQQREETIVSTPSPVQPVKLEYAPERIPVSVPFVESSPLQGGNGSENINDASPPPTTNNEEHTEAQSRPELTASSSQQSLSSAEGNVAAAITAAIGHIPVLAQRNVLGFYGLTDLDADARAIKIATLLSNDIFIYAEKSNTTLEEPFLASPLASLIYEIQVSEHSFKEDVPKLISREFLCTIGAVLGYALIGYRKGEWDQPVGMEMMELYGRLTELWTLIEQVDRDMPDMILEIIRANVKHRMALKKGADRLRVMKKAMSGTP